MRFIRRKSLSEVHRAATREEGKALRTDANNIIEGDETVGTQPSPATPFQCKPDISCWNFLPQPLTEKWKKLKR